ncbi:kinase interacting (KIP1-like) family protein [Actinidia rufa]|uniref:Kinase interacting (KIP1-like) family protein n=1 Tax=Actinidia rufa TaxID=165716 RepID=A0A7J0FBL8_9ERIC|nr:kinase interacting (KIP1-like) family protein [Actinidia rufa]
MEEKVEYIITIIEEDGDSFAQRAEMYYRKRPELLNFVEDSFRGYRALAERYDHLSRDLQIANRTIATVYPEQVQLAMDDEDEDEENFPTTTSTFPNNSKQDSTNLPAPPKLNIPKTTKIPSKAPARLMSKKGLIKMCVPNTTTSATTSGMSKGVALEEIDKLQKTILGLQTEKEFVKSLYESGVAKYWDIEKQVTEMQAKVNSLQDEFGIGTFIEDDEARTLMAATALKSCQETLIWLQEKQQKSDEEARMEYQRIEEVQEKLEILKENFSHQPNRKDLRNNLEFVRAGTEQKDLVEQESDDLELLRAKIKEQLQANSNPSLTISELAEKIDDLVDKVITLETAASSQNALVKRLRSETDELQANIRSLEEDKEALIEGSDCKSNKIRELEQEMLRIQNFNQKVTSQNRSLQIHFTEASFSADHLSEKLQTVKQDEEVEQVHEELESPGNDLKISKDVKTEGKPKIDVMEQKSSNFFAEFSCKDQVGAVSDAKPEKGFERNEAMMGSDHDSAISQKIKVTKQKPSNFLADFSCKDQVGAVSHVKPEKVFEQNEAMLSSDHDSAISQKINVMEQKPSNFFADFFCKDQVEAVSDAKPEKGFEGNEAMMGPSHDSARSQDAIMGEKAKKNVVRTEDYNFVASKPSSRVDDILIPVEVRDVPNTNPERRFKQNENPTMEGETKRDEASDQSPIVKAKENVVQSDLNNCLDDLFVKGQAISVPEENLVQGLNQHKEMMAPYQERDKKNDSPDLLPIKAEEENLFWFNPFDQLEDLSVNGQVGPVAGTNSEGFKDHETNDSVISTDVKIDKGEKKCGNQDLKASAKAEEENMAHFSISNPFDDLQKVQPDQVGAVQDVPERVFNGREGVIGPGNDSMISKGTVIEHKKNNESSNYNLVRAEENFVQSRPSNQLHGLLGEVQIQAVQYANPTKGFEEHEGMMGPANDSLISKDAKTEREVRDGDVPDHSTSVKANKEDEQHSRAQQVDTDHKVGSQEMETENEDQPDWRQMFMNGLDDRERTLLLQYTSMLRNYKETKKKLSEMEKEKHNSLSQSAIQINQLKNANALKDAEIQSLHKKLNLLQVCPDEIPNSDQKQLPDSSDDKKVESLERKEELALPENPISSPEKRVVSVDELHDVSMIKERFRSDIDGLLEENIEFWLRFSTSFHQIQKFQTSVQDLQEELANLRENSKKQDGNSKNQSLNSDFRPIYKHLREIQTELALWLEHNSLLEDDLQNRLSSLSSIQEEISRLSNAGTKVEETENLSDYQAAKFQGEVLNMKQENNKVGYKLQVGLAQVKLLKVEIEKTLGDLEEELGISTSNNIQQSKGSSSRSRIPLRSFLFGVRLRKQKPSSFFQCMSPALQKQYSDLNSFPT